MVGSVTVPPNQTASLAMVRAFYPAADILASTVRVLKSPREHYLKMVDGDPVMWIRYHAVDISNLLGDAGPNRAAWRKPLSEKLLKPILWLDGLVQCVIYDLAAQEGAAKGWTQKQINRKARFVTDHVNNSTNPVYRSGMQQAAAKSAPYRFVTWFKSAANRNLNTIIQGVQDGVKGKKGAWPQMARIIAAFVGMIAILTAVGTGRQWLTSGGKRKPTAGGLALDALENAAGNFYGVGDAMSGLRSMASRGTSYGYSPRANPLEQFTTESLKAAFEFGDALGNAVEGNQYKSGAHRGEGRAFRGLLRALEHTYRASAYGAGLPLAPLTYGKGIYGFATDAGPQPKGSAGLRFGGFGGLGTSRPPWDTAKPLAAGFGGFTPPSLPAFGKRFRRRPRLTKKRAKRKLGQWANPPWMIGKGA